MSKEKGMGLISIFLVIIIIIGLGVLAYFFIKNSANENRIVDIEANMLLIQGKCKVLQETSKVNNNTDNLKGRKLSEMGEDSIISEFLTKEIVPGDKLDQYYALSNDDLSAMGLDIQNEENSYYIVNYEENTVFITGGYTNTETNEVVYKLEQ